MNSVLRLALISTGGLIVFAIAPAISQEKKSSSADNAQKKGVSDVALPPPGTIIPRAVGSKAKSQKRGQSAEQRLRDFGAGCQPWGAACESSKAIPTSGASPKSLEIVAAAKLLAEDPAYPGMFVFEYSCSSDTSYVEVKVSAVLQPNIAPLNREMRTAQPCEGGAFIWHPGFYGVTGDTPSLTILMTEVPDGGEPFTLSPIVRALRSKSSDSSHVLTLSFPTARFQSFLAVPDMYLQRIFQWQAPRTGARTTISIAEAGNYRLVGVALLEPNASSVRLRVTGDERK